MKISKFPASGPNKRFHTSNYLLQNKNPPHMALLETKCLLVPLEYCDNPQKVTESTKQFKD